MAGNNPVSQKELIVQIILKALGQRHDPTIPVKLTQADHSAVKQSVLNGILDGSIPCSKGKQNRTELNYFVNSIISEWLRKDKRLNGNKKYKAKPDPQSVYEPFAEENFKDDPVLEALINIRKSYYDESHKGRFGGKPKLPNYEKIAKINFHIKKRIQDLALEKYSVNIHSLPVELIEALDLINDKTAA